MRGSEEADDPLAWGRYSRQAKPQVVRFVLNLVVDLGGVFEIDLDEGFRVSRVFLSAATGTG